MTPLARLIAIEDIRQLKARYFRAVDTRDYAMMGQTFCRDALFDFSECMTVHPLGGEPVGPAGPVIEGRDAIMAWIEASMRDFTSCHHGHCHEVTIDSESEAHGVIAMTDEIRDAGRTRRLLSASGHYWERYRFEDGAWRIAQIRLTRLFSDVAADGAFAAGAAGTADAVAA